MTYDSMVFETKAFDPSAMMKLPSVNSSDIFFEELFNKYMPLSSARIGSGSKCTDDDRESYTDRRVCSLITDINQLPPGSSLKPESAFIKMMFSTEKLDNGADPNNKETGIFALAAKLGAGLNSRTFISHDDSRSPYSSSYSLHIQWHGKDEEFAFA